MVEFDFALHVYINIDVHLKLSCIWTGCMTQHLQCVKNCIFAQCFSANVVTRTYHYFVNSITYLPVDNIQTVLVWSLHLLAWQSWSCFYCNYGLVKVSCWYFCWQGCCYAKFFFHSNRCYVKNAPLDSLYLIMYEYIIMAMIFVTYRHSSSLLQSHQGCC